VASKAPERKEVPSMTPENAESYINAGLQKYRQGSYLEAREFFSKAVPKAHSSEPLSGWRGMVFGERAVEQAVMSLLRQEPSDIYNTADIRIARGTFFVLMRDFTGAEAEFRKAHAIEPDNALIAQLVAKSLREQGRFEEALKFNIQSTNLAPEKELAWRGLALTFYAKGDFDKAEEAIEKALSLDSNQGETYVVKARILLAQSRYDEALESANTAVRRLEETINRSSALTINLMAAYYVRASILEAMGKLPEAESGYKEVLALPPVSAYHEYYQNQAASRLETIAGVKTE
jgi:Tfp pilus assembly protein PilF